MSKLHKSIKFLFVFGLAVVSPSIDLSSNSVVVFNTLLADGVARAKATRVNSTAAVRRTGVNRGTLNRVNSKKAVRVRGVNVNRNINVNKRVEVDVHHHHGHGHRSGPPPVAAVAAGVAAGVAIGTLISSLPKSGCSKVVVNGVNYYNCSGTYYQSAPNGYIVVAPPK